VNLNLTLLGQAISFAIFVWFCMKYVWPPVLGAVNERQAKILKQAAQAEIDQEVVTAREALRTQVSSIAVQGASRILGSEIDPAAHAKVLDDLIEQI